MYRYIFLIPFYLIISLLPLCFYVGQNFEYEYLLISTTLSFIFIPIAGLLTPKKHIPHQNNIYTPFITLDIVWMFFVSFLIYLIPALFVFTFNLCKCSSAGFWFWAIIQFYPAWICALAIYHLILRLKINGKSAYVIIIWLISLYVLLFLIIVFTLWVFPQKRITSFLLGFLHGPIYDDLICVDWGIVLLRLIHVLIGIFIFATACIKTFNIKNISFLGVFIILIIITHQIILKKFPSISHKKQTLDILMPNTLKEDGFTLHYIYNKSKEKQIQLLAEEIRFHIKELKEIFGKDAAQHVDIYVYPDTFSKKLWFGGEQTDITDVKTPSVHITLESFPHPTIRHELVHAISSKLAFKGLGFHPNMAFTEGLAVALAPQEYTVPLDQGAAYIIKHKKISNYSNLFSLFFWKEEGAKAYTVVGSIINFLITTYGIEPVKELYRGKPWDKVFQEPLNAILKKWTKYISTIYDEKTHLMLSKRLYKSSGILLEKCSHSIIDLTIPPKYGIFFRLRQPIKWNYVNDYWPWKLNLSNNDKLDVVSYFKYELKRLIKSEKFSKPRLEIWLKAIRNIKSPELKDLEDIELAILESDILKLIDEHQQSLQILKNLDDYSKNNYLGSFFQRQIKARIYIDNSLSHNDSKIWRIYLAGWSSTTPSSFINKKEPWIIIYLRIKNKHKIIYDKKFLSYVMNLNIPKDVDPVFYEEWYKSIGHRLMEIQEYSLAQKAYELALKHTYIANKQIIEEYVRKAKFFAQNTK